MSTQDRQEAAARTSARGRFLKTTAAAGAGLALAGVMGGSTSAATSRAAGTETAQDIINTALIAEQLATTFYYTGLTTAAVVSSPMLAGSSGNPNNVGSNGNEGNVAYFQAALDQERKHAAALMQAGAKSSVTQFYFPASTFRELGYTSQVGTFLWVLDHLETAFIGAYLAAISRFGQLNQPKLAQFAGQVLGVESEHRALGRVVAGDDPANNVTLEVVSFQNVSAAATVLKPYLTGQGFSGGATPAISMPTQAQITGVVGKNASS